MGLNKPPYLFFLTFTVKAIFQCFHSFTLLKQYYNKIIIFDSLKWEYPIYISKFNILGENTLQILWGN